MNSRPSDIFIYLATLIAFCLAACSGVGGTHARADKATFDAIAPEYSAMVSSSITLTPEQKERRWQTLRSWQARVDRLDVPVEGE